MSFIHYPRKTVHGAPKVFTSIMKFIDPIQSHNVHCVYHIDRGKGILITGHEGPRGMWMKGSTYTLVRGKLATPTFDRLYPGESSRY